MVCICSLSHICSTTDDNDGATVCLMSFPGAHMHGWTSPHKYTAPINVPPPTIYAFRTRNNSDNMFIHMVIMLMTLLAGLAGAGYRGYGGRGSLYSTAF